MFQPEFIKTVQEVLRLHAHSLDDWKTYFRWHTVHANAQSLPAAFVNENFDFFGKTLQGTKELRPRWKRCVGYANDDLGDLVGQIYVQQTFGAQGKERTLAMVRALEKALGEDIKSLPWMGAETKAQALVKLCRPSPTASAIPINGAITRRSRSRAATLSAIRNAPIRTIFRGS